MMTYKYICKDAFLQKLVSSLPTKTAASVEMLLLSAEQSSPQPPLT